MLNLFGIAKHLVCQDEIGDLFILTSFGEIYPSPHGLDNLRVVTWSKKMSALLQKTGVILNASETDDPLWLLDFPRVELAQIMAFNKIRRRPHSMGKWLKDKEVRLAHKIMPVRTIKKVMEG